MKDSHNRLGSSTRFLLEIVATFALILAIAIPRLLDLNQFVTTDERLWLDRSGKFYYALVHRDFAATFQKSHPGVTVMWAGLAGYVAVYPSYYESREGQNRPVSLFALKQRESDLPLRILVAGRQAIILLGLLALVLSFLFARRLFGLLPALVGFLLIAFDPFHIALSRVLHVDGLLADLTLLSMLAFLMYLQGRSRAALVVSAVAAGLAWLTKSPGLFLIPLIALLVLFDLLRTKSTWGEAGWRKYSPHYVKVLAAWGAIAVLVFCFLWPAMWVHPVDSVVKVLTDAIGYAQGGHESPVFFNGRIYPNGEIPDLSFYPLNFLWRTTPVTLLGLLVVPMLLIRRRPAFRKDSERNSPSASRTDILQGMDQQRWTVAALLLFALGFSALMNLGLKKIDRYILPSLVPLELVAGIGLVQLAVWVGQLLREKWSTTLTGAILLSLIAVQGALAWGAFPYFFNYYNPLLGGSRRAMDAIQIGWGEGLDQAARYINDKPNSDKIRVIAWYGSGPFLYFSDSRVRSLDVDHAWSVDDWDVFNSSDYAVVYIHQWQRNLPAEVLERLRGWTPEYSVWIDGLEYVRVYRIQ
ncbi:MAG: phospholipid carrier-dependent glycosyltransferase [Chloroflexota bacterium]|nr:MAG: phospholipid carrier-dependent glycosyltransferase [Chloroflexota bacterium]